MLEVLFARHSQEQAFLALMVCGLVLGFLLHLGALVRREHPLLAALWDLLASALGAGMLFAVLLRFHQTLRAYALLGMLLGALLYMAGLSQLVQGLDNLLQKYKNSRRQKEGNPPPCGESLEQKKENEVS